MRGGAAPAPTPDQPHPPAAPPPAWQVGAYWNTLPPERQGPVSMSWWIVVEVVVILHKHLSGRSLLFYNVCFYRMSDHWLVSTVDSVTFIWVRKIQNYYRSRIKATQNGLRLYLGFHK